MIGVAVPDRVESDLAAGAIACPGCGGALRPWGHARARRVRDLTTTVTLRPRRTRCAACRATHVLLPGTMLPRRADTTAVIGTALLASARGGATGGSPLTSPGRPARSAAGCARCAVSTPSGCAPRHRPARPARS